jgi:hypothetical protein
MEQVLADNGFSPSVFLCPKLAGGQAPDKSGKRNAIQTPAQPEVKKPVTNALIDLQSGVKSANIREFVTLDRSGWRPLAGGWSVQLSEYRLFATIHPTVVVDFPSRDFRALD